VEADSERLDGDALHAARGVARNHCVSRDEAADGGVVIAGSIEQCPEARLIWKRAGPRRLSGCDRQARQDAEYGQCTIPRGIETKALRARERPALMMLSELPLTQKPSTTEFAELPHIIVKVNSNKPSLRTVI
jgi:hypothetical protein